MNVALKLRDYLSELQFSGIADLLKSVEFLPVSCLLHRGDEPKVISPNRVIPDDFIYIPKKGALDCVIGNEQRRIAPGEFMMVPAGEKHGVTMGKGTTSYEVYALHLHIYDETHHRFLRKMYSSFGTLSDAEGWFTRLTACVCLMERNPEAGGIYMQQLVISLLIEQHLQGDTLREMPPKIDERISGLLGEIRRVPAQDWSVTRMATHCNLSKSRFRELFSQITGTSPKRYVQKVRLSLARSLLMTRPELPIKQVADQVGISDSHYFHAIYRQQFGQTPRQRKLD